MTLHFYNTITPQHLQIVAKDPYITKSTEVLNFMYHSLTNM